MTLLPANEQIHVIQLAAPRYQVSLVETSETLRFLLPYIIAVSKGSTTSLAASIKDGNKFSLALNQMFKIV